MAMNLDAVLRLVFRTEGSEAITKAQKALSGVEQAAAGARKSFSGVVNSASWQAAAVAAAGIGAAFVTSANEAIKFESAMADVRKVVSGLDDAGALREMENAIIDLSRELPITAEGLTQIVAAAGQAGIAKDELIDFARSAAQMGIAFDITADQAGEAMAKLRTAMGLSQGEVVNLADAMNFLSNSMASSAPEITDFMLRVGAMGQQVAMSEEQTAALGSAMIAAGAPAEVAATSFRNLIKALTKGESATNRQEAAFNRLGLTATEVAERMQVDAVGTMREVFQRLAQMPAELRIPIMSEIFGDEARALTPLLTNLDLFEQAMAAVADQSQYTGSMLAEFEARSGTTANQMQLFRNNVQALQIAIGQALLPALNMMAAALLPIVKSISKAATQSPVLTGAVVGLAAAFAALVAALPFIASLLSIISSLGAMGVTLSAVGATIAGWAGVVVPTLAAVGGAFKALLAIVAGVLTGPVGWIALLAAAAAALYVFREPIGKFFSWVGKQFQAWIAGLWQWGEPIRQFWIGLWESVKGAAVTFFQWVGTAVMTLFVQPWRTVGALVLQAVGGIWEQVKGPIMGFFNWWGDTLYKMYLEPWLRVGQLLQQGFAQVAQWAASAWSGVAAAFTAAFNSIGDLFNQYVIAPIRSAWTGLQEWMRNVVQGGVNALRAAYGAIAGAIRGAFNGILGSVGSVINSIIRALNKLIDGVNRVRGAVNLSAIKRIEEVRMPSFASGGFVKQPTVALVGEGGEPEYIVPESKMAAAAANYLSGARGDAVLNAGPSVAGVVSPSRGGGGMGTPQINITTGPVMQQGGQTYVTIQDLESAAQQIAGQIYSSLRRPDGRRRLGIV